MTNYEKTIDELTRGDIELTEMTSVTTWQRVLKAARATIGKGLKEDKEPKDSWKAKILLAEHSPIRLLEYDFSWKNIRQWVTAHLVRHHEGCEKFVHSQREDRRDNPLERDKMPQGARNDMEMSCNAQAFINISRKRMCMCASKETREAWRKVIEKLREVDPVLASKCVPECVYRGFCPEWMSKCGYSKTDGYFKALANYRNTIVGDEVKWNKVMMYPCLGISNTGHIREFPDEKEINKFTTLKEEKVFRDGKYQVVVNTHHYGTLPVTLLIAYAWFFDKINDKFEDVVNKDGNIWNNNINNLEIVEK